MNNNPHELVDDFTSELLKLSNNIEDIDTIGELIDIHSHFEEMLICVFNNFGERWAKNKGLSNYYLYEGGINEMETNQ